MKSKERGGNGEKTRLTGATATVVTWKWAAGPRNVMKVLQNKSKKKGMACP